jgi:2-hydroxychromene-2-carboxylate isomerase
VVAAFEHIWRHGRGLNGIASVASLLGELGLDGEAFESYATAAGGVALQEQQEQLANRDVIGTPTYLLGEEPFLGRQHLPLIRARLGLGNQAEPGSAD